MLKWFGIWSRLTPSDPLLIYMHFHDIKNTTKDSFYAFEKLLCIYDQLRHYAEVSPK